MTGRRVEEKENKGNRKMDTMLPEKECCIAIQYVRDPLRLGDGVVHKKEPKKTENGENIIRERMLYYGPLIIKRTVEEVEYKKKEKRKLWMYKM